MKKTLLTLLMLLLIAGAAQAQVDTLGKSPFFYFGVPIENGFLTDPDYCEVRAYLRLVPVEDSVFVQKQYGEDNSRGLIHELAIQMYSEDTIRILGFAVGMMYACGNPVKLSLYEPEELIGDRESIPLASTTTPEEIFCSYYPGSYPPQHVVLDSEYVHYIEIPAWINHSTGLDGNPWDTRQVWLSFFEGGEAIDIAGEFYVGVSEFYGNGIVDIVPRQFIFWENHTPPYHLAPRLLKIKRNKTWETDTSYRRFPQLFPIIEPKCEAVAEVTVVTDSAGCLVATWDSLPRQEQWVVAFNAEGSPSTLLDTVDTCRWRYCGLPAGASYQISVRSRCTNLRSFSWSKWSSPIDIAIEAVEADRRLHVTPNPTTGRVTLDLPSTAAHDGHVEVYSADGRHLASHAVPPASASATLDLSPLPVGLYLLRLVTPDGVYSAKVTFR